MVKKCSWCSKPIDVHEGHYLNAYTDPYEVKAYHTACYDKMVIANEKQNNHETG